MNGGTSDLDEVASFYESHPYPPPRDDLDACREGWDDGRRRRVEHYRMWPTVPYRDQLKILVAGCGTSQAARYAVQYPNAEVIGIDVSGAGLAANQALAEHHGLGHLELDQLSITEAGQLGERFDLVVCTGVLHHLEDPDAGLRALRHVLAPTGAMRLMVYAAYGRFGVTLMQDLCRRLGVRPTAQDIGDLVTSLRELPAGHPIAHLLRSAPDFQHHDALADALLNPRERCYAVPELLDLVDGAGLRFGRWVRQAPYRPQCGSLSEVPFGSRIATMDDRDQFGAVELDRGTIAGHSAILHRDDSPLPDPGVRWDDESWRTVVPLRPSTVVLVEDHLPSGVSAALLNRAHVDRDLVMFVDDQDRQLFESIDGERPLSRIDGATPEFFERLWWHDLVVIDASHGRRGAVCS